MTGQPAPRIDTTAAVKAASSGFTVLLLGGLAAPVAAQLLPVVGRYWLIIVAVAAFITAGVRIGSASSPALHGAAAAAGAYALVLPVVFLTTGVDVIQIATTLTAAVAVGGLSGWLRGRFVARTRSSGPPSGGRRPPSGGGRAQSRRNSHPRSR